MTLGIKTTPSITNPTPGKDPTVSFYLATLQRDLLQAFTELGNSVNTLDTNTNLIAAFGALFQPLDADLTALAALSATGLVARTAAATYVPRTITGTGLAAVTNGGGVAAAPDVNVVAASAADQEAGSSAAVVVTPSVQHRHPSAAKFWGNVSVSAGTPTLDVSYNVTSITDTATGQLTVTIATDFSGTNWVCHVTPNVGGTGLITYTANMAAGSILLLGRDNAGTLADPVEWYFSGYGDQA